MTGPGHTTQRQVTAYNDARDSNNPMHDDAVARAYNFKGALVPGVTVFGYMSYPLIAHFGDAWLDRGRMEVRFRQPVYADEVVTIQSRPDDSEPDALELAVCDPAGEVCATGRAGMSGQGSIAAAVCSGSVAPYRALPEPRWAALRERFEAERVLGSIVSTFEAVDANDFLAILADDHEIYRRGITHPAWLLRQANIIVDRNFDLGPWIHVASEFQNFARVYNGESVQLRAAVVELYERKGHEYVDLDVALLIDGDPGRMAMRVLHRAIYRMGPAP